MHCHHCCPLHAPAAAVLCTLLLLLSLSLVPLLSHMLLLLSSMHCCHLPCTTAATVFHTLLLSLLVMILGSLPLIFPHFFDHFSFHYASPFASNAIPYFSKHSP